MIPKIIHRIWLGGSMPAREADFGHRWQMLHPGWTVRTWREWNMPALRNQDLFDAATHPAEQADLARLELIHSYGGVYVDTDYEPLRPLDDLLAAVDCFLAAEDERWIAVGIFGAAPRHPFIGKLIDDVRLSAADRDRPINERTGPKFMTAAYHEWCERNPGADVTVFPAALFYPYHFTELERAGESFPEAYAVHRWQGSWLDD